MAMKCRSCSRLIPYLCHRATSSSASATSDATGQKIARPVRPPYYRSALPPPPIDNEINREFPNEGDVDGSGPRLFDYWQMGEMVRALPTASQRIDFVNPYEREWGRFEKKWHREWLPSMIAPRKAWNVPSVPTYFDSLNFYKYITKTRVVDGLDACYEGLNPPTKAFEVRLLEALAVAKETERTKSENATFLLRNIVDAALYSLSRNVPRLRDSTVSYSPRCESFWIRAGFLSMYEKKEVDEDIPKIVRFTRRRFTCDDTRRLGELSFVLRDEYAVQLRSKQPLLPVFTFKDEGKLNSSVFEGGINVQKDVIYSPKVFNMWPDADKLWQCPGYEPDCGEENKFGRIAFKNVTELNDLCEKWKVYGTEEDEIKKDCLTATSVASLFSWLNGQAHALGYTQYNDIEEPLVSQLVLSDGQSFFFAIAQLNTIAVNIDVKGFVNGRSNVCYVEGPLQLYSRADDEEKKFYHMEGGKEVSGLNPRVLSRLLQMFIRD